MTVPTPSRRRTYLGISAAVGSLLAASLVVPLAFGHPPRSSEAVLAQGPGEVLGSQPPGSSASAPAGPPSGAPGVPGALGTVGGPSSAGLPPGAPGAAAVPTSGAVAGPPTTAAAPPAADRRASGVGVTRDTVTLGVFLIDLSSARRAGVDVDAYDPEKQKVYWNAFLKDVNDRGGVQGRRIVPVYRNIDILDSSTFTAQCKQITETDRAFAVTNILGFYGPPILCVTRDHKTPWLAYDGLVSSYYRASQGRAFTVSPSTLRTELNLAARLEQSGDLPKKIGYLHEDGYLAADNEAVIAFLRKTGHEVVAATHSSSSSTNVATDLQIAAQKMCAAGVQAVFLATNALFAPQFVRDVDTQPGCTPSYLTSDFDFEMAGDTFLNGASSMPASYFRKALAVTSSRVGEGRVGYPEPAGDARCRSLFEKASGTKLDRNSTADANYTNVLAACGLVQAFVAGLQAAGVNPTQETFARGLAGIGSFPNPGFGASSFSGGRTDGPTEVRISQAFRDCGDGSGKACWKPREAFRRSAY